MFQNGLLFSEPPVPSPRRKRRSKIPRRVTHSGSGPEDLLDSSLEGSTLDALLDHDMLKGIHNNQVLSPGGETDSHRLQQAGSMDDLLDRSSYELSQSDSKTPIMNSHHDDHKGAIEDLSHPPQLSRTPVTQLGCLATNDQSKAGPPKRPHPPTTDSYRAVKDYDPSLFSKSAQPHLELPLKEGDLVHVLGAVDATGYHEAEVNGRRGLVPRAFLLPVYNTHRRLFADDDAITHGNAVRLVGVIKY